MDKNAPVPQHFLRQPVHFFAFGFGAGCVPKAPGTAGTLVGVFIYLLIAYIELPWPAYLAIITVLSLIGIWLCGITAKNLGIHDHKGIVWDEIAGFLIAMTAIPLDWQFILLGFFLFRLFDIYKPWPINYLDNTVPGGTGIMADDVFAGIYTCLILHIILYLL